jgi:phage repressor protein C with HTH and peptisase S24 domain
MEAFEIINEILKDKDISKRDFVKKVGVIFGEEIPEQTMYSYLIGKRNIPFGLRIPIAQALNEPSSLIFNDKETIALVRDFIKNPIDEIKKEIIKYTQNNDTVNPNVILLDKINLRAGAGAGGNADLPLESTKIAIDRAIVSDIKGLDPKNLKVIQIIGDSMEPEYFEGDYAVIDMVNTRCDFTKIGGVYIVRVSDVIYIKKIEFLPENKIKLISLNKQYGDMYPHKDGYDFEILGKVCGKIHLVKGLFFDKQGIE